MFNLNNKFDMSTEDKNTEKIGNDTIHSVSNSLIGRKIRWDNEIYTIIDEHNSAPYYLLDDKNMSMVYLHWENVKLLD